MPERNMKGKSAEPQDIHSIRTQPKTPPSSNTSSLTATSSSSTDSTMHHINNAFNKTSNKFVILTFLIPTLLLSWYAATIFFTPHVTSNANAFFKFFIWDAGQVIKNRDGLLIFCPRSSICAEGIAQLVMIVTARLTAFISYTFMTVTFVSKMHFLTRFLSSTYLRKYIPFENLHHIHVGVAKVYGGLISIHVLSHYVRYILRRRVDLQEQLQSQVHVSGLIGVFAILVMILGMSPLVKKFNNWLCNFETRINSHWVAMVVLCCALCFHHPRLRLVTVVLL